MAIENHAGFISSIHKDTLTPWITTTEADQTITFTDMNGKKYNLNSLTIEAETTDLYIQILPSEYCIYIKAGESSGIDYLKISQIKVLGSLGQKLRWSGLYYWR